MDIDSVDFESFFLNIYSVSSDILVSAESRIPLKSVPEA